MTGRCVACNNKLTDFENTRRYADTQKYVELCNHCFYSIPDFPPVEERGDLYQNDSDIPEDDDYWGKPIEEWEID